MLMTVAETAEFVRMSESWVRRHLAELPAVRRGRSIRIDSEQIKISIATGKSLEPRRAIMPSRCQRGGVYRRGKKNNMYYGTYRLDTSEGRRPINIRLGTVKELPTKAAARAKLEELIHGMMSSPKPDVEAKHKMTYTELVTEWKDTEGPAIRAKSETTYEHYPNALRAYVLPELANQTLDSIRRKTIQQLLNKKAANYSESALRSMRTVLRKTLGYAALNDYIKRPHGWLDNIALAEAHGRTVVRTELKPEQTLAIIARLQEPYATLVLFLALLGRRIQEAIGLQPTDLGEDCVLHIRRVVYNGRIIPLNESEQLHLPLDAIAHKELVRRIRNLGKGHTWVFHSRRGTLLNPGNARRRYLHPAAKAAGVVVGGWHDFRHTLTRTLRRAGVHPVVVSGTLGHAKVDLAMNTYDKASPEDIREGLGVMVKQLLPSDATNHSETA
jgi:integrase